MYGLGEQKTPESFRQACRRFVYTENLVAVASKRGEEGLLPSKPLQPTEQAAPAIRRAVVELSGEDEWVPFSSVGKTLSNLASDFDPRNFSYRKLSDLIGKINEFELDRPPSGTFRIRIKATKGAGRRKVRQGSSLIKKGLASTKQLDRI